MLNGVDYDVWNPETDPLLPGRYSVDDIGRKHENAEALRDRFGCARSAVPWSRT